jgi:hypothetical protein
MKAAKMTRYVMYYSQIRSLVYVLQPEQLKRERLVPEIICALLVWDVII